MRIEPMHQAGEELLDALRARLGWRPSVTSFEATLWPWVWSCLRPFLGQRVMAVGRTWYVGDPTRLLDAAWAVTMVAHEGTHALAAKRLPFYTLYFLQQILFLLAFGVVGAFALRGLLPWWVPTCALVAFAIPWPAPNRAVLEAEAYAVQIVAARFFGVARGVAIEDATRALAHRSYWMTPWPWTRPLTRLYHAMVLRALWDPRARLAGWTRDVQEVAQAWGYVPVEGTDG
jgi:hypothetical protein